MQPEMEDHFLGTLASAGYIHTPNDAPEEKGSLPGGPDGPDAPFPVGQSNVGFKGVAGGMC